MYEKYVLKFTQLSKYTSTMIVDPRSRISKFDSSVSEMVVKECLTTMLINDMDICLFMVHAQLIKKEKLKEKSSGEDSKGRYGNFSHLRSNGHIDKDFPVKVPPTAPSRFNKENICHD